MGSITLERWSSQARASCDGVDVEARGDFFEFVAGGGNFPGGEGKPGDEADIFALAVVEDVFGGAIDDAVFVLDGDDGNDFAGVSDLSCSRLR